MAVMARRLNEFISRNRNAHCSERQCLRRAFARVLLGNGFALPYLSIVLAHSHAPLTSSTHTHTNDVGAMDTQALAMQRVYQRGDPLAENSLSRVPTSDDDTSQAP